MSRYVAASVYRKKVGSMARKAILAYCAERANDDGSGVWASKVTISKEVECSKKTVIDTFRDFVSEGILIDIGKRKISNGFVRVYNIDLSKIDALEDAISREEMRGSILNRSPDYTPRGEVVIPQEVNSLHPNRPRTVLEPSKPPNPQEGGLFSQDEDRIEEPDLSTSELFHEFWQEYPKKTGKGAALKAFEKALKRATAQQIINGAKNYARWLKVEIPGEFKPSPKHPQGWLNADRWLDEEIKSDAEKPMTERQMRLKAIVAGGGVVRGRPS